MPKTNTALAKMKAGKPAFGYAVGSGSPIVTEILAHCGIDFLLLDNQHGSFGTDGTILCLMAAAAGTATPMIRPARNDYTMIGRVLDEGALGIVVPMVENASDARAAADACRFPPRGRRSWGYGRAASYGDDYTDWVGDELFVAVQIESAEAAGRAEEILATPGIDGCWIGPADLALSLGIHPSKARGDERHEQVLQQVLTACRNTGKIPGLACQSAEEAARRAAQGFQFLTAGGDGGFLRQGALAGLKQLGLA
ncbi:MAG: HpcH/HpaI aldolase family protein [Thermomicrobiales bacterium]